MIRILLFWMIQAVLLAGAGALLQQLMWKKRHLNLWETTWFGLAGVVVLLQLWHFFFPVNALSLGLMTVVGLSGVPLLWKERQQFQAKRADWVMWAGALLVLALLYASHVAVRSIPEGDTRLYHLNMVRWNNEYPLVPGLANLHQRFGVNSTWLLYSALLDIGWADGRSAWLVSGLPWMLVLGQWCGVFFLHHGRQHTPAKVYCLITLPFLLEGIEWAAPSLYYDKPPLLLLMVVGLHVIRTSWMRRDSQISEWIPSATAMLTLAALSFSLKASCALALAIVSAAIVIHWWKSGREWMALVRAWWLPTLLVAGYMANNYVTSGWPLFPAAVGGIPFDWAQPAADVKPFYQLIADWARLPGSEGVMTVKKGFWAWWPLWVHNFSKTTEHTMAMLAAAGSALVAWKLARGDHRLPWKPWCVAWMCVFGALNVLFWMLTAPDLRFGDGLFYFWLAMIVAIVMQAFVIRPSQQILFALVLTLGITAWVKPSLLPRKDFFLSKVWDARPDSTKTDSQPGTPEIQIPTESHGLLGDCALPASPRLDPRLRYRVPGDMSKGFRLETK